jgi:hypothetical protein
MDQIQMHCFCFSNDAGMAGGPVAPSRPYWLLFTALRSAMRACMRTYGKPWHV